MLYPSIQEILKATAKKDGEEKLNKYSVTMATAKCARVITNEYNEQLYNAEKKIAGKETEKELLALVNKDYRDEKSVKNALKELKEGKFEVYLPGDEGYEESLVEIKEYEEPKEESKYMSYKDILSRENSANSEELDSKELMGANEVFENDNGYSVEEQED